MCPNEEDCVTADSRGFKFTIHRVHGANRRKSWESPERDARVMSCKKRRSKNAFRGATLTRLLFPHFINDRWRRFCCSVEREASKNIEENERECFKDAIVSSRSLNKGFVEPTNLKNAIREVPITVIIPRAEATVCFYFVASSQFSSGTVSPSLSEKPPRYVCATKDVSLRVSSCQKKNITTSPVFFSIFCEI